MLDKMVEQVKIALGITLSKSKMVYNINELNDMVKTRLRNTNDQMTAFLKAGVNTEAALVTLFTATTVKPTTKDAVKYLEENLDLLERLGKQLVEEFETEFPKIIVRDHMTSKQVALYSLTETFNYLVGAHSDLLVYMTYSKGETFIYKNRDSFIRKELSEYYKTMKEFKRVGVKSIFKDIDGMSDTVITAKPDMISELASAFDKKIKLPINKFDGNPVTVVGKWIVDIKLSRADKLEYDMKLMQLRLIHMREASAGNSTVDLSQQIEYYENLITKLDRDISELRGE